MRLSRKIHIGSVSFLGSKGSNGAAVWSTVSLLPSLCSSFLTMLSSHASCEDSFCLSACSNVELSGKSVSVRKCPVLYCEHVCRESSWLLGRAVHCKQHHSLGRVTLNWALACMRDSLLSDLNCELVVAGSLTLLPLWLPCYDDCNLELGAK